MLPKSTPILSHRLHDSDNRSRERCWPACWQVKHRPDKISDAHPLNQPQTCHSPRYRYACAFDSVYVYMFLGKVPAVDMSNVFADMQSYNSNKRVLEQKVHATPGKKHALQTPTPFRQGFNFEKVLLITDGKKGLSPKNAPRNQQLVNLAYYIVFSTCSQIMSSLYPGHIYGGLEQSVHKPEYMDAMVHTFFLMDALTSELRVTRHKLKQIEHASMNACRVLCTAYMQQNT